MNNSIRTHLLVQPFVWALIIAVGLWYANDRDVPLGIAVALLPAFLIELVLYIATASEPLRAMAAGLSKPGAAACMTLAAAPSYIVYTVPSGLFDAKALVAIVGMAAVASFWYVVGGKHPVADAGFLLVMAVPVLFHLFEPLYPAPAPRIPVQALGAVMWYRTGILAVLSIREIEGVGFGLVPTRSDWAIGLRNFALFLPVAIPLAFALQFVRPTMPAFTLRLAGVALLYFVGTLLFLAVAEEFFFRGLLQQMLSRALRSKLAGLLVASVLFGLVHLGFREFPNWRFALLAAIAGVFYGRAFIQASSIRAAMVTHALVVTVWRVFLF